MSVFTMDGKINTDALDVLYEIGNLGVGTAIVPIGNLREIEFRIGTPNVVAFDKDIYEVIDYDPNQVMLGVVTRMNNTFKGSILFLLSKTFVQNTVEIMTEEKYDEKELLSNEDSVSAIQEMINYMTAGYAKVIGSYLSVPVFISSVTMGIDQVKNVVQSLMEDENIKAKKIACVKTAFTVVDCNGQKTDETGQVLILPDEKSIEEFIKIMK